MFTFKDLRRAAKEYGGGVYKYTLAVLGNCSTQFLAMSLKGYFALENMDTAVFDADYNQIDAQLLDGNSEVFAAKPDYILIWLATEKLYEEFLDLPAESKSSFADSYIAKIENYWDLVEKKSSAKIIQFLFTEIDDKALGNFSCKVSSSFIYQIRKLNFLLQSAMEKRGNVFPVDLLSIQINMGRDAFFDAPLYYGSKMTVSTAALPYIAEAVGSVIKAIRGNIKKCVVLDLDNTLWGGVVGDDGPDGIEIGELGRGHAFTDFQRWLKQLKECGIILTVCSKNNEDLALEPFRVNDEMVLRENDIALFVANWDDKASNIKMIRQSLNIGMDSMVFIDDNAFERGLVRSAIPEIEVPELPEDPALYLGFLQSRNYFETAAFTGAGSDRTGLYRSEFERIKAQAQFDSIDDYLASLDMVGAARPFEPSKFSRIAQLTQRSNQFNLRTVRYTESEVERLAGEAGTIALYYTLKDKFGDHGLVAVVVMKEQSPETLFVDTWLMSCRVLKRGMEEFTVNGLVAAAKEKGYKKIVGEYLPTAKNAMVKDLYPAMGFTETSPGRYELEVGLYEFKKTFITEEH